VNVTIRKERRAMTSGGLVKLSVQLAAEQVEALDRLAAQQRVSRSAIVRQFVDAGLARASQAA
jgi:metal-responsive CopG/Arc/MetJ family transcriptional regulator